MTNPTTPLAASSAASAPSTGDAPWRKRLFHALAVCGLWLLGGPLSAAPAWWSAPETKIFTGAYQNNQNWAPANVGQLRHVATQAMKHLEMHGGAGPAVVEACEFSNTQNYAPANVGQLKNLAAPFYDRLAQLGYNWQTGALGVPSQPYPWTGTIHPDNAAPINIGQLKYVFSFDLTGVIAQDFWDSDGDGLDDQWEITHYGDLSQDGTGDLDGDGVPDFWELATGTNPALTDSNGEGIPDTWATLPGTFHQPTAQEPWWVEESVSGYQFIPSDRTMVYNELNVPEHYYDVDTPVFGIAPNQYPDVLSILTTSVNPIKRHNLFGSYNVINSKVYLLKINTHRSLANLYSAHKKGVINWIITADPLIGGEWPSLSELSNLNSANDLWFSYAESVIRSGNVAAGVQHAWESNDYGTPPSAGVNIQHIRDKRSLRLRAKAPGLSHDVRFPYLGSTVHALKYRPGDGTVSDTYPSHGASFTMDATPHSLYLPAGQTQSVPMEIAVTPTNSFATMVPGVLHDGHPYRFELIQYKVLLPVEIVDKNKAAISKLKVGKMSETGVLTGTEASAVLDIDKDSDRFYIRVPGGAALGGISVKVSTTDNPDSAYNDNATQIDLQTEGNDAISKSLLLVSDDVDDDHPVDGIADDATGDRTHKVQLGGNFKIEEIKIGSGGWQTLGSKTPVPVEKTVAVGVVILRNKAQASGGTPVIAQAAVKLDLKIAQERYAQTGIKLTWSISTADPPAGVDLSNGLDEFSQPGSPTAEETALFNGSFVTATQDDIQVIYVNALSQGSAGEAFRKAIFNSPLWENVIISAQRRPFTLPHELGHVLSGNGTHESAFINLMRSGTSSVNQLGASKNLFS